MGQANAFVRTARTATIFGKARIAPRRMRVLLVEDEGIIALHAETLLTELGHAVCGVAASGMEAVHKAAEMRPDLILMDIRLGNGIDGVTAAHVILRRYGIRSVFVSADSDPATRRRIISANPLGFVAKPYSPESLAQALADAADRLGAGMA